MASQAASSFAGAGSMPSTAPAIALADDTTWDTGEVELWLMNDEGLYNEARRMGRRATCSHHLGDLIRETFGWESINPQIDLDEVDWEHVGQCVLDDIEEEESA